MAFFRGYDSLGVPTPKGSIASNSSMKTMKLRISALTALIALLVLVNMAIAQERQGEIRGRVTDPNGAVVPGARVLLSSQGSTTSGTSRGTTTNSEGEYSFQSLPLGNYELTVSLSGFARPFKKAVELSASQLLKVDIVFSFAACSDEPEITGVSKFAEDDHAEIVRVLVNLLIGDGRQSTNKEKIIFSPDNFSSKWLLAEQRSRIAILSRADIQEITEKNGELTYYSFTKPIQRGRCVAISLVNNRTVKGQMEDANMAGGEDNYEFRKVDGKWTALLLSSMIS
ncbi:MAG: carboxypeptidase regulatory-like domain-containing protein [Acidobacteriota bacterium]|nr:MAG: carboxypeptidase regulatory-like domain-containing protein [Acidobacteriota bacterium]